MAGAVCYQLGRRMPWQRKPGRRYGATGEVKRHCWGGRKGEEWAACALGLSEGGATLAQALSGQKPRVLAMGDQVLLVEAIGGWKPLLWAKGSMGLSAMWCLLRDLQAAGTDHGSGLGGQRAA